MAEWRMAVLGCRLIGVVDPRGAGSQLHKARLKLKGFIEQRTAISTPAPSQPAIRFTANCG
jgi:hypothetical protein